jgi:Protein of unknown function (DUF1566)
MSRTCQTTVCFLLVLLPLSGNAQTCWIKTINATTPTARFTSFNNGTVLDKYTGLIWKKCSEGQQWNAASHTCHFFATAYNWQEALQQAQTVNSSTGFAGYKDWRVPNIKELNTLLEEQCEDPAINLTVFPTTPGKVFWSSSPHAGSDTNAWAVDFYYGYPSGQNPKDSYYTQVRLVRGRQ